MCHYVDSDIELGLLASGLQGSTEEKLKLVFDLWLLLEEDILSEHQVWPQIQFGEPKLLQKLHGACVYVCVCV